MIRRALLILILPALLFVSLTSAVDPSDAGSLNDLFTTSNGGEWESSWESDEDCQEVLDVDQCEIQPTSPPTPTDPPTALPSETTEIIKPPVPGEHNTAPPVNGGGRIDDTETSPPAGTADHCTLHGVVCDLRGRVIELNLTNNGMDGYLPLSIGLLTELRILDLTFNDLTGEIPESFQNLSNLEVTHLGGNNFTCPVYDYTWVEDNDYQVANASCFQKLEAQPPADPPPGVPVGAEAGAGAGAAAGATGLATAYIVLIVVLAVVVTGIGSYVLWRRKKSNLADEDGDPPGDDDDDDDDGFNPDKPRAIVPQVENIPDVMITVATGGDPQRGPIDNPRSHLLDRRRSSDDPYEEPYDEEKKSGPDGDRDDDLVLGNAAPAVEMAEVIVRPMPPPEMSPFPRINPIPSSNNNAPPIKPRDDTAPIVSASPPPPSAPVTDDNIGAPLAPLSPEIPTTPYGFTGITPQPFPTLIPHFELGPDGRPKEGLPPQNFVDAIDQYDFDDYDPQQMSEYEYGWTPEEDPQHHQNDQQRKQPSQQQYDQGKDTAMVDEDCKKEAPPAGTEVLVKDGAGKPLCTVCNPPVAFATPGSLRRHNRTQHLGEKRFKCPKCHKLFGQKSNMTKHVNSIHLKKRPFPCDRCTKKFKTKDQLKNHYFIHTGDKPYPCRKCGKPFRQKSTLLTHLKKIHNLSTERVPPRAFHCRFCDRVFLQRNSLTNHEKSHNKSSKPFLCTVCGKRFMKKTQYSRHFQTCGEVRYKAEYIDDEHERKVEIFSLFSPKPDPHSPPPASLLDGAYDAPMASSHVEPKTEPCYQKGIGQQDEQPLFDWATANTLFSPIVPMHSDPSNINGLSQQLQPLPQLQQSPQMQQQEQQQPLPQLQQSPRLQKTPPQQQQQKQQLKQSPQLHQPSPQEQQIHHEQQQSPVKLQQEEEPELQPLRHLSAAVHEQLRPPSPAFDFQVDSPFGLPPSSPLSPGILTESERSSDLSSDLSPDEDSLAPSAQPFGGQQENDFVQRNHSSITDQMTMPSPTENYYTVQDLVRGTTVSGTQLVAANANCPKCKTVNTIPTDGKPMIRVHCCACSCSFLLCLQSPEGIPSVHGLNPQSSRAIFDSLDLTFLQTDLGSVPFQDYSTPNELSVNKYEIDTYGGLPDVADMTDVEDQNSQTFVGMDDFEDLHDFAPQLQQFNEFEGPGVTYQR